MLYKYLPAESGIKVIDGLKLRFTPPSRLNDPFEMRPIYTPIGETPDFQESLSNQDTSAIGEELLNKGLSHFPTEFADSIPKDLLRAIFTPNEITIKAEATLLSNGLTTVLSTMVYGELDKQVGVLCLSECATNTVMWGNYANSHTGIVLGFNQEDDFFNASLSPEDPFRKLVRVTYTETRKEENILDFPQDSSFLFNKTKPWEYEREWRMLLPLMHATEVKEIENDILHLFTFPPSALKEVIFGLRTSEDSKSRTKNLLNRPEFRHVVAKNVQESDFYSGI